MAVATLLDIAKLNGNDKVVGLIEENLAYAPEVSLFPARTIRGTSYTTVTRTAFPSVGFRTANDGSTPSKSAFVKKLVEAYIFGGTIQVDKAIAMAHEDGAAAWEMIEANGVMKQALINLGSQVWYGVSQDANGFPGMKAALPIGTTTVLDALGNTGSTQSSVYGVKFGPQDCTLVVGNGGSFELSEFYDQQIAGATAGTWLPGRVADLCSWLGLQANNVNSIGKIANLTVAVPLTDTLIAKWLSQYPVGYRPDRLFMSRRSAMQLQISRTVVINGGASGKPSSGAGNIADSPTSAFDIPITVTDSILDTDARET
jgi:hypothetical protein